MEIHYHGGPYPTAWVPVEDGPSMRMPLRMLESLIDRGVFIRDEEQSRAYMDVWVIAG